MRYLATIGYWAVAVLLLASVVSGSGYPFDCALFVASAKLPGMFCAKFILPEAFRAPRRRGVAVVAVGLGIVVVEWVAMLLAHRYMQGEWWQEEVPFPTLFSNPAFLVLLLAAIVIPETLLSRYLDRLLPRMKEIAFVSDRRRVTLEVAQIVYVESNDDEVLVHTLDGGSYRTKTRISQWERLLDDRFVRIHRAYIVNSEQVVSVGGGQAVVAGRTFDLSRKYREGAMRRMKKQLREEPSCADGGPDANLNADGRPDNGR